MKKNNRVVTVGFVLVITGLFLLPAIACAQDKTDPGSDFNRGSWYWVWALFSLIMVVALAYWATRFLAGKFGVVQAKHLKVAESLFLGPNRHLYLLLVDKKVLLIGSSENGLTLIKEIDDPDFYEEVQKTAVNNQAIPNGKFANLLDPIFKGLNPRGITEVGLSNRQRLQDGLEKLRQWKMKGKDQ